MDGYAVRTDDFTGCGPWTLPVIARIAAGDSVVVGDAYGAARIFTGAPVPAAFDAIVMQERVTVESDSITIREKPRRGQNLRRAGENFTPGTTLIRPGSLLSPARLALAASQGLATVGVRRKVKVAIFATGSELREPGTHLEPGQIYNSNRYMLRALLTRPYIELLDLGAIPDDPDQLASALRQASARVDVIVTTGGVSVGDEDHMPRLVNKIGGTLEVLKVAMKPGKPLTIGTIGKVLYIGLPGNPFSAYVTFQMVGRRLIEKCAGLDGPPPLRIPAVCGATFKKRTGRCEFVPVTITHIQADGLPVIQPVGHGSSADMFPMAVARGLAVIEPGGEPIREGDQVPFLRFADC